jgi:hypothetical protein
MVHLSQHKRTAKHVHTYVLSHFVIVQAQIILLPSSIRYRMQTSDHHVVSLLPTQSRRWDGTYSLRLEI